MGAGEEKFKKGGGREHQEVYIESGLVFSTLREGKLLTLARKGTPRPRRKGSGTVELPSWG